MLFVQALQVLDQQQAWRRQLKHPMPAMRRQKAGASSSLARKHARHTPPPEEAQDSASVVSLMVSWPKLGVGWSGATDGGRFCVFLCGGVAVLTDNLPM